MVITPRYSERFSVQIPEIAISAPSGLLPGTYGSRAYMTFTPTGPKLNVEFDPTVDPDDCEHPVTVGM